MNLYPYVVEPNGTLPWTGPTEFPSVSPCMDAILESKGGFESFRARFLHNQPPTPEKWAEILIHEGHANGGPDEAGYLLGRARLPLSEGSRHVLPGFTPGGAFETGYLSGLALPQVPMTRNLEWGFFGVWRTHYLSTEPGDPTNGKLPPPSVAWTFLLSSYLELHDKPPADILAYAEKYHRDREHHIRAYLDMPPGRHFCEGAMSEIALGIRWKVAILHELIGPPARFLR